MNIRTVPFLLLVVFSCHFGTHLKHFMAIFINLQIRISNESIGIWSVVYLRTYSIQASLIDHLHQTETCNLWTLIQYWVGWVKVCAVLLSYPRLGGGDEERGPLQLHLFHVFSHNRTSGIFFSLSLSRFPPGMTTKTGLHSTDSRGCSVSLRCICIRWCWPGEFTVVTFKHPFQISYFHNSTLRLSIIEMYTL